MSKGDGGVDPKEDLVSEERFRTRAGALDPISSVSFRKTWTHGWVNREGVQLRKQAGLLWIPVNAHF